MIFGIKPPFDIEILSCTNEDISVYEVQYPWVTKVYKVKWGRLKSYLQNQP